MRSEFLKVKSPETIILNGTPLMDLTSDEQRGKRLRAIREAIGETQEQFADRLNVVAAEVGLGVRYKFGDISGRETGRKSMEIEDFILAAHVDPHHRTVLWLAFGREIPIKYLGMLPKPPKAAPASEDAAGQGKHRKNR